MMSMTLMQIMYKYYKPAPAIPNPQQCAINAQFELTAYSIEQDLKHWLINLIEFIQVNGSKTPLKKKRLTSATHQVNKSLASCQT